MHRIINILQLDRDLFLYINSHHDTPVDFIMYWASNRLIWIPFYAWLLYVLIKNYKNKIAWVLPAVVVLIICTDQTANLFKNTVMRLRPCHEPTLQGMIHLVNDYCGGQYGFFSSHAANAMGLAVFVWNMLPKGNCDLRAELIAYVLLVSYSRIYLAAHYPLDVLGGWLAGSVIGYLISRLLRMKVHVPDKISPAHE